MRGILQLHIGEQLLRNDPVTYELYYGRNKKGDRQSAANILPILVKKGLISEIYNLHILSGSIAGRVTKSRGQNKINPFIGLGA